MVFGTHRDEMAGLSLRLPLWPTIRPDKRYLAAVICWEKEKYMK